MVADAFCAARAFGCCPCVRIHSERVEEATVGEGMGFAVTVDKKVLKCREKNGL